MFCFSDLFAETLQNPQLLASGYGYQRAALYHTPRREEFLASSGYVLARSLAAAASTQSTYFTLEGLRTALAAEQGTYQYQQGHDKPCSVPPFLTRTGELCGKESCNSGAEDGGFVTGSSL